MLSEPGIRVFTFLLESVIAVQFFNTLLTYLGRQAIPLKNLEKYVCYSTFTDIMADLLVLNLTTQTTLWLMLIGTAPQPRWLAASFHHCSPDSIPGSGHVRFVGGKVALSLIFSK